MGRFGKHTLRRQFWIGFAGTLAIVLAACGGAAPATPAAETSAAAEAAAPSTAASEASAAPAMQNVSGEITVMNWNVSSAVDLVFQQQAEEYSKSHPGATVSMTLLPFDQYQQKLPLLFSSGTPPDSFGMPGDIMRYVEEDTVLPLDDYMKADPIMGDPSQIREEANNMVRFSGGHVYASQSGTLCSMQLYYNQELFDKAGVAYPDDNWTWDDFRAAAQKLTIREGEDTQQWGADLGYLLGWDGGWQALAASFGAEIMDTNFNPTRLNFDAPEVIEGWQYMQDLVYKDKVAPPPSVRTALDQAGGPFLSGKVAMVPDGCWQLATYKEAPFKLGMALLPQGKAARVHPIWYANAYVIPKASKNPDLAWDFLRWLATDQKANEMMASAGLNCGAPVVRKYDDLFSTAWKEVPGGDACVRSLDTAKYFQIYSPKWQETFDSVIAPEWEKFLNGTISAQELSTAITEKANAGLQ